jgi:hypothetical protein
MKSTAQDQGYDNELLGQSYQTFYEVVIVEYGAAVE